MIKKPQNNDIFKKLDWVLKKKGKLTENMTKTSPFIINRWLSMADFSVAQIVNTTINRWILQRGFFGEENFVLNFFRIVLPKVNKRISYIKKISKEKSEEDYTNLATCMEISKREVFLYEKTLAEINSKVK